jgi:riboflavin kinase / FMN adenylyltransferase
MFAPAPRKAEADMDTQLVDWRNLPANCRGGAVTIGNFDGVHRGHAALLAAVRARAAEVHGPGVAFTFDPRPLDVLRPGQSGPPLMTTADRVRWLLEEGADHVLVVRTTPELLALTADTFFTEVVQQRLAARALVEGPNFGFGRARQGDVGMLAQLCRANDIALTIVPPVQINGEEVSSSRVRATLLRGDVAEAADLLGRPYRLSGVVGTGQRRGQTLGFPTANLEAVPTLIPGDGVYAVRAYVSDTPWPAAANIGPNPTFGENARKVEVHLIGFHGDLYGEPLAVDLLHRLRDTRPFRNVTELIEQLQQDIDQARRIATV